MVRSTWKGPFAVAKVLQKVEKMLNLPIAERRPIKTWCRAAAILPWFVDLVFLIHNGKSFVSVLITEDMVGRKLGELAPTRKYHGHGSNRKS